MTRLSGNNNRFARLGRAVAQAVVVTLLAFLLSALVIEPLSFSTMSLFSAPEKSDFEVTDLYAQVADRRPVRTLDPNIVIVDIRHSDRSEITDIIETVSLCGPRAIGLDVMFEERRDSLIDSRLAAAIAGAAPIVLPVGLAHSDTDDSFSVQETPFFTREEIPGVTFAASNLPGKFDGATIREFATIFPTADGRSFDSFPLALARIAAPEAAERLLNRGNKMEYIDYSSREYTTLTPDQLADNAELLADKIVLIGAVTDAGDIHSTPINSYMSGLSIHAASLSTILGGKYYRPFDAVPDWVPACILCFLILLVRDLTRIEMRGILTRILQLIIVYFAVRLGYSLYVDRHIIFDFSYTLLMVVFGFFALDIWYGLEFCTTRAWRGLKNLRGRQINQLEKS